MVVMMARAVNEQRVVRRASQEKIGGANVGNRHIKPKQTSLAGSAHTQILFSQGAIRRAKVLRFEIDARRQSVSIDRQIGERGDGNLRLLSGGHLTKQQQRQNR